MSEKIVKPPLSLANKILKIMQDVEYLQKDNVNSFHKYKYITEAKVSKVFRDKFIEYKMILIPSAKYHDMENGITNIDMTVAIICCETGEKIEVPWAGQGADKGDKGMYKAFTGGLKYFLMKTFMLPTGDDPEKFNPELEQEKQAVKSTRKKPIKAKPLEDILND